MTKGGYLSWSITKGNYIYHDQWQKVVIHHDQWQKVVIQHDQCMYYANMFHNKGVHLNEPRNLLHVWQRLSVPFALLPEYDNGCD